MRLLVLFVAIPLMAQFPKIPGVGKRSAAAQQGKVEFNRDFYENLKNFAEGLYKQKERPDFRAKVDQHYEALLREHAKRAFDVNTSPHSEIKIILEDRFRYFTGLYDNLMMQDLVNRIGQDVGPKWSEKLFTFKLLANPVPSAEALATGTIYISTGLVASLDNKAQLAYVLAHESAHVAKDHWKTRIMIDAAKEEYARMKEENREQIATFGALVGLGAGIAARVMGTEAPAAALIGAGAGLGAYALAGGFASTALPNADWNQFEEDEADEVGLKSMLDAKLNVQEVPKLYVAFDKLALKDDRVGMGFWGSRNRMQERLVQVRAFLTANVKGDMKLTGSDPDFRKLISELKRDNGILAYHQDMLEVARANLEQAVDVKNADPEALYYYAKILNATAKTDEERSKAVDMYSRAIQRDNANHAYGAYLHRATALIERGGAADKQQAAELLERYVERYVEAMDDINGAGAHRLPPHMDTIVDYMRRAGVEDWKYGKKRASAGASAPESAQMIPASAETQKTDAPKSRPRTRPVAK